MARKPVKYPRWVIDDFVHGINQVASWNKVLLEKSLEKVDLEAENAKEEIAKLMNEICGISADHAARLAAEFYDQLHALSVGTAFGAEALAAREPKATYIATAAILKDGITEAALGELSNRLSYETKRAAGNCIKNNALAEEHRTGKRIRWARVPQATKSYANGCEFCQMLASRGFVYVSEASAGEKDPDHYHANCNCAIVPSFDKNTSVEGYDPGAYSAMPQASEGGEQQSAEG